MADTRFPLASIDDRIGRLQFALLLKLHALARGDAGPLQESIWRELKFDEERQFWNDTWLKWVKKHGELKGVEVIGTRTGSNSLAPGVSLIDTYVQIRFERGSEVLIFNRTRNGASL